MIHGIGIDIIELKRIRQALFKNERFIDRILSEREKRQYFHLEKEQRKLEFLAGRFAAKEAFAKAVGSGIGELNFRDIEVVTNDDGAPQLRVSGYSSEKLFVSISHSKDYAVAQVVITI